MPSIPAMGDLPFHHLAVLFCSETYKTVSMGVPKGGEQNGNLPSLEIGTKSQKFVENLKSAA